VRRLVKGDGDDDRHRDDGDAQDFLSHSSASKSRAAPFMQ
jgi:hypothetical protein